jgi:hypothetical protein
MQHLILDRPRMKSLQKFLEEQEQVHVKELVESNISYQELQKNYEQAMDNDKRYSYFFL